MTRSERAIVRDFAGGECVRSLALKHGVTDLAIEDIVRRYLTRKVRGRK
jgi:hypothetical protein